MDCPKELYLAYVVGSDVGKTASEIVQQMGLEFDDCTYQANPELPLDRPLSASEIIHFRASDLGHTPKEDGPRWEEIHQAENNSSNRIVFYSETLGKYFDFEGNRYTPEEWLEIYAPQPIIISPRQPENPPEEVAEIPTFREASVQPYLFLHSTLSSTDKFLHEFWVVNCGGNSDLYQPYPARECFKNYWYKQLITLHQQIHMKYRFSDTIPLNKCRCFCPRNLSTRMFML